MKPSRRMPVSKSRSAGQFRRNNSRTNPANMVSGPMRGGWRF